MLALPSNDWCGGAAGAAMPPAAVRWKTVGSISHVFSHFSLDLEVQAGTAQARSNEPGQWWPIDQLKEAGLPTVFAKAAALAQKARDSL
jgi:A/G-specific adenine glycosylase